MTQTILDLKGLKCPLPALKARKALTRVAAGNELLVLCTDPMAAIDIPNLIRETGDALLSQATNDGVMTFVIKKAG
jgi:tRNA 2-thiouridine synthesizing protein A